MNYGKLSSTAVSSYYHNHGYDMVTLTRNSSSWNCVHRERQSVKWPICLLSQSVLLAGRDDSILTLVS